MRNRNTILALAAAGLLTVVAFTPALPEGLQCSDYPNIDTCPLYGGYGNSRPPTAYQVPSVHIRHAQAYQGHHHYH